MTEITKMVDADLYGEQPKPGISLHRNRDGLWLEMRSPFGKSAFLSIRETPDANVISSAVAETVAWINARLALGSSEIAEDLENLCDLVDDALVSGNIADASQSALAVSVVYARDRLKKAGR